MDIITKPSLPSLQSSGVAELLPIGRFNISGPQKGQSITPDGKYLFSLSAGKHIDTYSINNDKSLNKLTYEKLDNTQNASAVSADGKVLYVATNGYINSYNIAQDGVIKNFKQYRVFQSLRNRDSKDLDLFHMKGDADNSINCVQTSITTSPDGKFLIATSGILDSDIGKDNWLNSLCKEINVFKINDNHELTLSSNYQLNDYQYSATVSRDSKNLYTISRDRNDYYIQTYRLNDGNLEIVQRDFLGASGIITHIATSPVKDRLYFSMEVPDGYPISMRIFMNNYLGWVNIEADGKLNRYNQQFVAIEDKINSIVFSNSGDALYTGHDNYIQWYNTTSL